MSQYNNNINYNNNNNPIRGKNTFGLKDGFSCHKTITTSSTSSPSERDRLVMVLSWFIVRGDIRRVLCLLVEFNTEFKQCTLLELSSIDKLMRASKRSHPEFYNYFFKLKRYNVHYGAFCFINRIPFLLGNDASIERHFTSYSVRMRFRGYPDCIDINPVTKSVQGWKLYNVYGKQNLPVLKFGNKYDIITKKKNFEFYKSRFPGCRLRDPSTFVTYARTLMEVLEE